MAPQQISKLKINQSAMAPSHSSSSCSSNSPYRSHDFNLFTSSVQIQEGDGREEEHRSPLYGSSSAPSIVTVGSVVAGEYSGKQHSSESVAITCNNCLPASLEKHRSSSYTNSLSLPSPNAILKTIRSSVARLSPKPSPETSYASEEQWKIAVAELSQMLVEANRKREKAVLEASDLKYSIADLEKKLNRLEIYCHNLKSSLEIHSTAGNEGIVNYQRFSPFNHLRIDEHDQIIQNLLVTVSEARSAIRTLSRAITNHIRQIGTKALDRISSLLQPFDIEISLSRNPRPLVSYLEALLNLALFEDFESAGFMKSSTNRILNPLDRCKAKYAAFRALQGLTWEEVLGKGTKHFSKDFSKFCDRKMREIVGMLGWNRAWPEPILHAFFKASKSVWLIQLLANSVYPSLPIFRIENGSEFDFVYMEDMGANLTTHGLVPTVVRIMVSPGFYVYDNVIKCKVLCRYHSISSDRSGTVGVL